MDAGNLGPVAEVLRRSYPSAASPSSPTTTTSQVATSTPASRAATKAATAIDARLAIPPLPGDANDLAILQGRATPSPTMVAGAAFVPPPAPTYPEPALSPETARAALAQALRAFMAEVPAYWRAVGGGGLCGGSVARHRSAGLQRDAADLVPPLLGLPVDVGLGKTSTGARRDCRTAGVRRAGHPQGGLRRAAPRPGPGAGRGVPGARRAGDALEGTHGAGPHAGQPRAADVPRYRGDLRRARGRAGGRAELLQGPAGRRTASLPPLPRLRLSAPEGGGADGAGHRLRPRQPLPHEARAPSARSACW